MSIEEKLEKCIEFIKKIEKNTIIEPITIDSFDGLECDNCGSSDIYGTVVVGLPDSLRDKAWHLLVDIDSL